MIRFFFILATIISVNSFAQTPLLVDEWKSYPVPSSKDSLMKYNYSKNWYVTIEKDKIIGNTIENECDALPFIITTGKSIFDKFYGEQSIVKVSDGFLVGFYRGEWGGSLYWFSEDGKQNYKISDSMVIQFIKRENKLYAIEGLAHMGLSYGSIIEINNIDGKWTAKEYLSLPSSPAAIALDKANSFIVITSNSLLQINRDATITTLIEKGFWKPYLYPASATINMKNNTVYLGMRGGVFKYNLTTKIQEWLMPY